MKATPQTKVYDKKSFSLCLESLIRELRPVSLSEKVCLTSVFGRRVSNDMISQVEIPEFPTSIVDGFAVDSSQTRISLPIIGSSFPGKPDTPACIKPGEAIYVSTGATIPRGADCVIPIENCKITDSFLSILEDAQMVSGQSIRTPGSDTGIGDIMCRSGTIIGPGEFSLLHACKIQAVDVYRKVRLHILSTGAEVVSGQIGDANKAYLMSRLGHFTDISNCIEITDLGVIPDDEATLTGLVSSRDYDVLITTGGVSKGRTDYMKPTLEKLEFQILFGQVDLKPGKPTTVAVSDSGQFVFALPGNPASCFVTFNLFVLPALLLLSGQRGTFPKPTKARLRGVTAIQPDSERPEFLRGTAWIASDGSIIVDLVEGHQRSSRAASLVGKDSQVNCLVRIPPGPHSVSTDTLFDTWLLPGMSLTVSSNHNCESAVPMESKARAFDSLVEWLKVRTDVENIELMNLAGFCRNCLSKWLSGDGNVSSDDAKKFVYGMEYEDWKKLYRKGDKKDDVPRISQKTSGSQPCASSIITRETKKVPLYVLTVSDRASAGIYADLSGPAVEKAMMRSGLVSEAVDRKIVPDEISEIRTYVKEWLEQSSGAPSVIITTGGTGFSPRDVTPEAIDALLEKKAPGLVHLLLSKFRESSDTFCLSRLIAGVAGKTLIVTLPGSPQAVEEGMRILIPLIPKIMTSLGSA